MYQTPSFACLPAYQHTHTHTQTHTHLFSACLGHEWGANRMRHHNICAVFQGQSADLYSAGRVLLLPSDLPVALVTHGTSVWALPWEQTRGLAPTSGWRCVRPGALGVISQISKRADRERGGWADSNSRYYGLIRAAAATRDTAAGAVAGVAASD